MVRIEIPEGIKIQQAEVVAKLQLEPPRTVHPVGKRTAERVLWRIRVNTRYPPRAVLLLKMYIHEDVVSERDPVSVAVDHISSAVFQLGNDRPRLSPYVGPTVVPEPFAAVLRHAVVRVVGVKVKARAVLRDGRVHAIEYRLLQTAREIRHCLFRGAPEHTVTPRI